MSAQPARPTDPASVLIVEDQDDLRHALEQLLEHAGFRTIACSGVVEALTVLQSGARVCLIVLDLMMPGLTGFQFREEQRAAGAIRDIPVLVLTGVERPSEYHGNLHAVAYIRKPVDPGDVIALVRQHCGSRGDA